MGETFTIGSVGCAEGDDPQDSPELGALSFQTCCGSPFEMECKTIEVKQNEVSEDSRG